MQQTTNSDSDNTTQYSFGYTEAHIKILQQRNFDQHGKFFLPYLKPGMKVLDCGCGPGTISLGIAKAVAPGEVIAIDIAAEQLKIAAENAEKAGIKNITFQLGDAANLDFAANTFDFVYAQTLLCHCKNPLQILTEQKRVTKTGSFVAARDQYKPEELLIYPTNQNLNAALKLYYQALLDSVGNIEIGIKLAEYFIAAGLQNVRHAFTCENWPANLVAEYYGNIIAELPHTKRLLAANKLTAQQLADYKKAWLDFGKTPGAYYGLLWADAIGQV